MNLGKRLEAWRLRAAILSLVVGLVVLGIKFLAYRVSGSTAILSDALESIVNVIAAAFAIFAVAFSLEPPDRKHPYGHGKIEFVTAIFEGGLISFAAILIVFEAINALVRHHAPANLDMGLWLAVISGILNGALGGFLMFIGRQTQSMSLEADGKHVFSDFLTTIALVSGLFVVKWSGLYWLDPMIALAMAVLLLSTGIPLIREAIGGLLDAENPLLLEKIRAGLEKVRPEGIIRVHHVRAMRNGRRIHVDGHVVIPEFWTVQYAHDFVERYEKHVVNDIFLEGEIEFHVDPCRRAYCSQCEVKNCPIRTSEFLERPTLSIEEMVNPLDRTDLPE